MSDRDAIEAVVRESYNRRRTGDVEAIMAMFGPDPRFRLAGDEILGELTAEVRGKEAFRAMIQQLVDNWDWADYKILSILIEGDSAVVHSTGTMRFVPTGQNYETETLDLLKIADGKIVEFLQFLDTHMLARALGRAA